MIKISQAKLQAFPPPAGKLSLPLISLTGTSHPTQL